MSSFIDWLTKDADQFGEQVSQLPLPLGGQTIVNTFRDPGQTMGSVYDFFANPSGPGPMGLIPFTEGNPIQTDTFGNILGALERLRQRSLEADRSIAARGKGGKDKDQTESPAQSPVPASSPSQSGIIQKGVVDYSNTARGQRSDAAAWIDTLDNKTYNSGGKSVTAAAGVVLQHSGIKVDDKTAMEFRKGARQIIEEYNKAADPSEKEIHNYYDLLTGYLLMLQQAQQGKGQNLGDGQLTAPDGSQIPAWNPNMGQVYDPIQPGMNSVAVRQQQMQGSPVYNTPQEAQEAEGGLGVMDFSPIGIGNQIGNLGKAILGR